MTLTRNLDSTTAALDPLEGAGVRTEGGGVDGDRGPVAACFGWRGQVPDGAAEHAGLDEAWVAEDFGDLGQGFVTGGGGADALVETASPS
jgi:hypothetical protein